MKEKNRETKEGEIGSQHNCNLYFPIRPQQSSNVVDNVEDSALCDCGLDMATVQTCLKRQSADLFTQRGHILLLVTVPSTGDTKENESKVIQPMKMLSLPSLKMGTLSALLLEGGLQKTQDNHRNHSERHCFSPIEA